MLPWRHVLAAAALSAAASVANAVHEPPSSVTTDASIVAIDEPRYLGAQLRPDTVLTDGDGRDFKLGDMLGKPVILLLSYYRCDGTCPTMNGELAKVIAKADRFQLGRDYRVLTVSFDARDSEQSVAGFLAKTEQVPASMRDGWRHAVVKNRETAAFAAQIGYRFFWSDAARAFMHPNVLVFLTPQGRVARYIYGTRMDARTLELALIDADWNRIAESTAIFDMITGACFSYNYVEGKYQPNYAQLIGIGSLIFGVLLIAWGAGSYQYGIRRTGGVNA